MKWFQHLAVQIKLGLGFGAIIVLLALVGVISYTQLVEVQHWQARLIDQEIANASDLLRFRLNLDAERLSVATILDVPKSEWDTWKRGLNERSRDSEEILVRLTVSLRHDPLGRKALTELSAIYHEFKKVRETQVFALLAEGKQAEAQEVYAGPQLIRFNRVRALASKLEADKTAEARRVAFANDARTHRDSMLVVLADSVAILVALALAIALRRMVGGYLAERQRAEESIRHLASIVESSDDAIIGKTLDERIVSWNKGAERIYGYAAKEIVGRPISVLVPPGLREELAAIMEGVRRGENVEHLETTRVRKDGQIIQVALTISPIKDDRGQIVGASTIARDITGRKRAEAALQRASAYNRSLIEASLDPLVTIGPDGKITDVNSATETVTGRTRAELIGTDFSDYFTEPEQARAGYEQAFREGLVRDYALELRHRDGHVTPVLYNASVYHDEQGNVTGVFTAARDITERKRAEEQLHKEIARGELLLELHERAPQLTDKQLYDYAIEQAVRLTESAIGFFHLVSEDQQTVTLTTWNQEALKTCTAAYDSAYPLAAAGNWVDCVRLKRPVIYNDFANSPNRKGLPPGHTPVRRFMSIPVLEGGQVRQIFGVGNKLKDYDEHDMVQLQLVANELQKLIAQRRAEAALRSANAYNRSLIEASLDPLVTIGPDGKITDVNSATETATGRTRSELIGTDFSDYFTEPQQARAGYEQVFREGLVRDYALGLRHRDGHVTDVLYNASVYRDEQGKVTGVFAAARDITERKRAELEREQYHKFFILSNDPMCIADPFGCFKQVNAAFVKLTGYSESELVSKPFIEFVVPEERQRTVEEMERQVKVRPTLNFENRYLRKDQPPVLLSWTAFFDRHDGVTYATARDITELKRAEKALEESEKAFRTLAESVPQIVWTTRADGWNTYFNQRWVEYTGLTLEESYGHGWNIPFHPEDQKRAWDAWQQATQHGGVYSLEARLRRADGVYRWWLVRGVPICDATGKTVQWFGTCTDIHDLKVAEAEIRKLNEGLEQRVEDRTRELAAANKELESFSYSVSHDLRSPLRSIDGFSRILLEDYADKLDAEGKDNLQRVRIASQRMGHLIDDVLKLSRITRSEMRRVPVDLTALAQSIVGELRVAWPGRRVECDIAGGMTTLGDPGLLRVALENLLDNAWKFTGRQPEAKIEMGCQETEGERGFFVRDNGAGFDMKYVGKLFGAFQRLHDAEEFPGTGIGLATVQRIVHRHGGRVWAEGAVGRGATFYFTLPVDPENHSEKL